MATIIRPTAKYAERHFECLYGDPDMQIGSVTPALQRLSVGEHLRWNCIKALADIKPIGRKVA
jgi:hypothetical protein